MNSIEIWTDGSANNATNSKGGYGIVMVNGSVKQFCGGSYNNTTSARMELMGVIKALEKCEPGNKVKVYCDNRYVVDSLMQRWAFKWASENWKGRKNKDLLKKLLDQYHRLNGKVTLLWVKGHNNNPYNELADRLACMGANSETIFQDKM